MTDAIDPAEITAKGCRWVRAADGRTVEYSVTGSTRPDARTGTSPAPTPSRLESMHDAWAGL